jgi:hypothetical protein
MITTTINGVTYECDAAHSQKDYTGWDWNQRDRLDGLTIEGSCFSQETPNSHIFPADMTGVTFISCNLDNVFIPDGNTVIQCSQKSFEIQNDLEDWIVDENDEPIEPVNKKQFERLGLSTDPADLPDEPLEKAITSQ